MYQTQLIPGGKWAPRFYFYLTLLVMAGLCLMLIPDGAIEAVTGSIFGSGN